ncbi:MAG: type I restriction enzyme S subunit [Myxococcota bacterium]
MSDHDELPLGWTSTTLGQVLHGIQPGKSPKAAGRPAGPGEKGGLKVSAVSWREFNARENKALPGSFDTSGIATPRAGDLLISRANTVELVGAVVLVREDHPELILCDKTLRLDPTPAADPGYLLSALRTGAVREHFEDRATGTSNSMRNISQPKMRSAPLAPLNEQRRIVAKIDALQARSRRAREALDAIPALLDRFRQSVLASAFRGDLTADWRANHPDVEPASVLLERIRAERKVRWIAAAADKARARAEAKAAKAGKPWGPADDAKVVAAATAKAEKKYAAPEPVDAEAAGLPELPEGWCWARAADLAGPGRPIIYGIIKGGPHHPGGVPMVRVMDITSGDLSLDALKHCNPERAAKFSRATLREGDLLVSKDGTIGRVALVPPHLAGGNITQHVLRFSPANGIFNQWLKLAVESPGCQAFMSGETKGVALQGVNVGDFRLMPVPLCGMAEQREVVRIAGSRNATDSMSKEIDFLCGRLNTLDQAILAKAFRGELVPQDPTDEPASVLLDRIRAEREANPAPKKTRRKR